MYHDEDIRVAFMLGGLASMFLLGTIAPGGNDKLITLFILSWVAVLIYTLIKQSQLKEKIKEIRRREYEDDLDKKLQAAYDEIMREK